MNRYHLSVVASALVTACAAQHPNASPPGPTTAERAAYASSPDACALVVGGGGTQLPDEAMNRKWIQVNGLVTDAAFAELRERGFRVEKYLSAAPTASERSAEVGRELAARRCNRIVQIGHVLEGTPGDVKLGFEVSVLGLEPSAVQRGGGSTSYTLTDLYQRKWSWDLTREVMEKLSMRQVGSEIGQAVAASGALEAGTRGSGAAAASKATP